jgi:hypothetical protein
MSPFDGHQHGAANLLTFFAELIGEALAWLPATPAGLAWRLLCLDAAVIYATENLPWRQCQPAYRYVQVPCLKYGISTGEDGQICTMSTIPMYTGSSQFNIIMPPLPPTALTADATELSFDVPAMVSGEDDQHLRNHVPAGA